MFSLTGWTRLGTRLASSGLIITQSLLSSMIWKQMINFWKQNFKPITCNAYQVIVLVFSKISSALEGVPAVQALLGYFWSITIVFGHTSKTFCGLKKNPYTEFLVRTKLEIIIIHTESYMRMLSHIELFLIHVLLGSSCNRDVRNLWKYFSAWPRKLLYILPSTCDTSQDSQLRGVMLFSIIVTSDPRLLKLHVSGKRFTTPCCGNIEWLHTVQYTSFILYFTSSIILIWEFYVILYCMLYIIIYFMLYYFVI